MKNNLRPMFTITLLAVMTLLFTNCGVSGGSSLSDSQATPSTPVTPATKVGDCLGGGVVFYVSSDTNAPDGQKGLIAAPTDADYMGSSMMSWQQGGTTTVSTTKTYFTGETNTNTILAEAGIFPAATAANAYTVTGDDCTNCTAWYLPSQHEIATLYIQSTSSIALGNTTFWSACNGTTPALSNFWSSTQNTASTVFSVSFLTGIVTSSSNASTFRVRAVRAF